MSRRPNSQPNIILARAPMPTFCGEAQTRDLEIQPLRPLGLGHGPTHVIVIDAAGARGYGMLHRHSPRALDALDALLDYHDAANEGPDGLLPHQRPGATILDLPLPRKTARRARRAA
jgi:hypothetical protein